MESNSRNIYRNAREASGLSQERWATFLGVSVESVRLYETGRGFPSDEVVARMADVAAMPVLCYWHLKLKSGVANDLLPEVEVVPLPQAVLSLLVRVQDFQRGGLQDLVRLSADGKISQDETIAFGEALAELGELITAAYELQYAKGAE